MTTGHHCCYSLDTCKDSFFVFESFLKMWRQGMDKRLQIGLQVLAKAFFSFTWRRASTWLVWPLAIIVFSTRSLVAQDYPTRDELKAKAESVFGAPQGATSISKSGRVWVDPKRKLLIVDGFVTLTQGQLEMFACPVGTKEHESVVAVFAAPKEVHAGLLAIGAKQGTPTQFEPYRAATGSTIKVYVLWRDAKNEKNVKPAQHWILDVQKKQEMPYDWVFAGSIMQKDPDTGEEYYLADSGAMLCVANFPEATLDIAIESISTNDSLVYGAYTDHIPPLHTVCRLVLQVSADPPRQAGGKTLDAKATTEAANPTNEKKQPSDLEKMKSGLDELFRSQ